MSPDPDCYGCQGTGCIVGFGSKPKTQCPCSCCHECGVHTSEAPDPFHEDEGHVYCKPCYEELIGG